jgi:hypothetical protein
MPTRALLERGTCGVLSLLLFMNLGACGDRPQRQEEPRGFVDTEESLFPEPADRTRFRLAGLKIAVERFDSLHGKLPERVEDFTVIPPGLQEEQSYRYDAWRSLVAYTTRPPEFELRSAGPDRVLHTADDIVLRGTHRAKRD